MTMWNNVILCLGSNTDCEANLKSAAILLRAYFGAVQLSPDTRKNDWDACAGYHYSDSLISGFSHTHLSGTGCGDYGDVLLMPTVGRQDYHAMGAPFKLCFAFSTWRSITFTT